MSYVTGTIIRELREQRGYTQKQLAAMLDVSDKAVSKWETDRGLPDATLLEPLARALGVSIAELLSGESVANRNLSANLLRSVFYQCPVCGNLFHATGEAVISCCGVQLPPLSPESPDPMHEPIIELIDDEWVITVPHPMEKTHHLTFMAYVTTDRVQLCRLYAEQSPMARFTPRGSGYLYLGCNRDGLFRVPIKPLMRKREK